MIRKIFILGLILLATYIFYKKFMADTVEPFFKRHDQRVLQLKTSGYKVDKD